MDQHSQLNLDIFKPSTSDELNKEAYEKEIHPAFVEIGTKMINNKILGSSARCVALLSACKKYINDYETPSDAVLSRDLEKKLEKNLQYLRRCRPFTDGMDTAITYTKYLLTLLTPKHSDKLAKEFLSSQIEDFIKRKIIKAKEFIVEFGLKLIKEGDTILTYGRSHLIEGLLCKAHEKGIKFNLIVVDNPPYYEGKDLSSRLSKANIKSTYTLINGVSYFMKKVDKVFVGCSSVLSNGNVISRVGTAMVTCIAQNNRIPVHVFSETYKFSELNFLDSFGKNELDSPQLITKQSGVTKYNVLNLRYDMTPKENVNMVITEIGQLPPTSVPVIIREFVRNNYVGKIVPPEPDMK